MENIQADIVVIGGGAAGLAAAISAKRNAPNVSVLILERLDRLGKKILSTGNGRCNLTNRFIRPENYFGSVENVMSIIENTAPTEDFFRSLGVICTADDEGRAYPMSRQATSVRNALLLEIKKLGIKYELGFLASDIIKTKHGFAVTAKDGRMVLSNKVIIACGGKAAPSMGTDGSMLKLLEGKGYKTIKPYPAIAPLAVSPENVKGLKGVRAKGSVSAISNGKTLRTERGEIQFTEKSLSGICVFNLAYLYPQCKNGMILRADFMPDTDFSSLCDLLFEIKKQRACHTCRDYLDGIINRSLGEHIIKRVPGKPLDTPVGRLSAADVKRLAAAIKALDFTVTGCADFTKAQVTGGGISGECTDENLQSRREKGLYFCGEILDVCGDCGGYNLEWAWSSGQYAGKHAAVN